MPVTKVKPFNYQSWLKGLKVGDELISLQGIRPVVGVTDNIIMIDVNDNILHFCRETGRQMGNKTGSWKDGALKPYTDEARAEQEKRQAQKKMLQEKEGVAARLMEELNGQGTYHCSTSALMKQPITKLVTIHKALAEINTQSFTFQDWEQN